MKDKKRISVRKLAAVERAKALGLETKRPEISAFERQAREWKRREEAEESKVEGEKQDAGWRIQDAESRIQDPRSRNSKEAETNKGFDWEPYQREQAEAGKKAKDLNAASIWRLARKIMAREWARALGGRGFESDEASIERKASEFREKKAAERERKELEHERALEHRAALQTAVQTFGRNLLKAPKPATPESAEALFQEALHKVGETIRVTWQPDGCHILLEPWAERRLRQKSGETMPAVFQATIDDDLKLISYQRVEDPHILHKTQKDMILKKILLSFRKSPGKDLHAFEAAVAEEGRIIRSTKMDSGWKINFEPWEEMKRRNLERKGRPPIVTYVIKADQNFSHISCQRI